MATSPDPADDELRPEYDFRALRGVVRGKYHARYHASPPRFVRLADDVAGAFPDDAAVNAALREHLRGRTAGAAPVQPADAPQPTAAG